MKKLKLWRLTPAYLLSNSYHSYSWNLLCHFQIRWPQCSSWFLSISNWNAIRENILLYIFADSAFVLHRKWRNFGTIDNSFESLSKPAFRTTAYILSFCTILVLNTFWSLKFLNFWTIIDHRLKSGYAGNWVSLSKLSFFIQILDFDI